MIRPTSPVSVASTSTVLQERKSGDVAKYFVVLCCDLLCECEESNIILGIRSELGEADKIDSIFLSVKASGKIISISLVVAVVETEMMEIKFC